MTNDVVVVGGGLAGSAAAVVLARAGKAVTLLERDRAPVEKVCGEFLTEEACRALESLGLSLEGLGAVTMERLRLHAGNATAECPLPFRAAAVPRRVLDPALRQLAEAAGASVRLGARVRSVASGEVHLAGGESIRATSVILATGKHDLRDAPRQAEAGWVDTKVGFKCHLRLRPAAAAALQHAVELFLFPGGYAGLLPVGDGIGNLSFVLSGSDFAVAGRTFEGALARISDASPALSERLSGHVPTGTRCAVAAVPYGYRTWRDPGSASAGVWRVGDQAAVTPSFTGAGMAIALASGILAAHCIAAGMSPASYRKQLKHRVGSQIATARLLEGLLAVGPLQPSLVCLASAVPRSLVLGARITRLDILRAA